MTEQYWPGDRSFRYNDGITSIAETKDGGYVTCGYSSNKERLGDNSQYTCGVVIKYNSQNEIEWTKSVGDRMNSIIVNADGDIIVGGIFKNTINIENYVLKGSSSSNGMIIKYSNDGKVLSAIGLSVEENQLCNVNSLFLTADGGILVGGSFSGILDVDGTILNSKGHTDGLIIKYNNDLEVEWVKSINGDSNNTIERVEEMKDGGLIAKGSFDSEKIKIEKYEIKNDYYYDNSDDYYYENNNNNKDIIIKFNSSRELEWINKAPGENNVTLTSLVATNDGGVIVVGYFTESLKVGKDLLISNGAADGLIIKYNVKGNIEWATSVGGTSSEYIYAISLTKDGGFVIGGQCNISNKTQIGDYVVDSKGGTDGIIIKYNCNGEVNWAKSIGGIKDDCINAVIEDSKGSYLVGGYAVDSYSGIKNDYELIENNKYSTILENTDEKSKISTRGGGSGEDYYITHALILAKIMDYTSIYEKSELIVENKIKRLKITTDVEEIDGVKGGNITGEDENPYETVVYGDPSIKTIVMEPDENYEIIKVTINGEEVPFEIDEEGNYKLPQFENMTENKHIVVTYARKLNKVIISKIDNKTKEILQGIRFKLDQIEEREISDDVVGNLTDVINDDTETNIENDVTSEVLGDLVANGSAYNTVENIANVTDEVLGELTANGNSYNEINKENNVTDEVLGSLNNSEKFSYEADRENNVTDEVLGDLIANGNTYDEVVRKNDVTGEVLGSLVANGNSYSKANLEQDVTQEVIGDMIPNGQSYPEPNKENNVTESVLGELTANGATFYGPNKEKDLTLETLGELTASGKTYYYPNKEKDITVETLGELTASGKTYYYPNKEKDITAETLGELIPNGKATVINDLKNDVTSDVLGQITSNGSYYFTLNVDGTYIPTNGKTYQKSIGNSVGIKSSTANSYMMIDLTGKEGFYQVEINARVSSERTHDCGYATIKETITAPAYSDSVGRFMYIHGTKDNNNYTSDVLKGGRVYYLHFGYKKDSSVDTNEDQVIINDVNVYNVEALSYDFVDENGKYKSSNQGKDNTTANSYMEIDLTGREGKYQVVVDAEVSSQQWSDYGYATITETTTAPTYSNSTGRFVYISGTSTARMEYNSIELEGNKKYYLHLGYYKNASTSNGNDELVVHSVKVYESVPIEYSFVEEKGVYKSNNKGQDNTTANSYMEIDLTGREGKYQVVVDAEVSSEQWYDYGYATITETTTVPTYSSSTGRFIYINGTNTARKEYNSIELEGNKKYYLHLGYYKNASTSNGNDELVVHSVKVYESVPMEYSFVQEKGVYKSNNKGQDNTTANSYMEIDLTGREGKYQVVVDADISSENYDYGYATITKTTTAPSYNNSTGRFMYTCGEADYNAYTSEILEGGNKYYLHLGYSKTGNDCTGDDQLVINSVKVYESSPIRYSFVYEDGVYRSNNQGKDNTTANSYMEIDLTGKEGKYQVIVNAEVSSQPWYDYGYATITETTTAPLYSNSTGRFMEISGTTPRSEYHSMVLDGNRKYYLHLGYYKNYSTSTGDDQLVINSIDVYSMKSVNYEFIEEDGKYKSNNIGKNNTTADSYIKIDLTGREGKYYLSLNTTMYGDSNDYGYIKITNTTAVPDYNNSEGRIIIYGSNGDTYNKEYNYSNALEGGNIYYLHFEYKKGPNNSKKGQLIINSINIYGSIPTNYNFIDVNGKYESNNQGKFNTTANSYLEIDLTNKEGKYQVVVNAETLNASGNGYATITEDINAPSSDDSTGRLMYLYTGTNSSRDYFSQVLEGGKKYYLHLGYQRDGYKRDYSNIDDKLTINSINVYECEPRVEKYFFEKDLVDGKIKSNNQGKLNTTASSYMKIDLTKKSGKYKVKVNASLSGTDSDYGYAVINQSKESSTYPSFMRITGTKESRDYISSVLNGGEVYYLQLRYSKGSRKALDKDDQLVINNIAVYEFKDSEKYNFREIDGKYESTNQGKQNSTSESYIPIDLTGYLGKYDLIVNAEILCENYYDYGTATISNNETLLPDSDSDIQFIYIYGKKEAKDYNITLEGGKKYYLHLKYYKNGYENYNPGDDKFTINSVKLMLNDSDLYHIEVETNEDGQGITQIPYGRYSVTEVNTPEGYQSLKEPIIIDFKEKDGQPVREIITKNDADIASVNEQGEFVVENKQLAKVIVHHYIKGTENTPVPLKDGTPAPDQEMTGELGEEYTTSPLVDTKGYELQRDDLGEYIFPENKNGNFGQGDDKYIDENGVIHVTYWYENSFNRDITVAKKWNHIGNKGERPTSVILQVKNGEEVVKSTIVTSENKIEQEGLSENEEVWQYTFVDIPKYDDSDNVIAYTVDEAEVTKDDLKYYKKEIDNTTYTVTNTYIGPIISSEKSWTAEPERKYTDETGKEVQYVLEGDTITYTVTVTNEGGMEKNVKVKDEAPKGTSFVADSIEVKVNDITVKTKGDLTNGVEVTVPAKNGDINGVATVSFKVNVEADAIDAGKFEGTIINIATVDEEDTKKVETPVKKPNVEISKSSSVVANSKLPDRKLNGYITANNAETSDIPVGYEVMADEEITYSIKLDNSQGTAPTKVKVKDSAPSGTRFVDGSIQLDGQPTYTLNSTEVDLANISEEYFRDTGIDVELDAGQIRVVSFKVIVVDTNDDKETDLKNNDKIINTAQVSKNLEDPNPTYEDTNEVTHVYVEPKLSLEKTLETSNKEKTGGKYVEESETITYTITVTNEGGLAKDIKVIDELPDGVTFVDNTLKIDGKSNYTFNGEVVDLTTKVASDLLNGIDVSVLAKVGANNGKVVLTFDVTVDMLNAGEYYKELNNIAKVEDLTDNANISVNKSNIKFGKTVEKDGKDIDKENVRLEDELTYNIWVSNIGGTKSDIVKIFDNIPDKTEYVANSVKLGSKTYTDEQLEVGIDGITLIKEGNKVKNILAENIEVGPDKTVTLSFKVKVSTEAENGYVIKNRAYVNENPTTPDTENSVVRPIIDVHKEIAEVTHITGDKDAEAPSDTLKGRKDYVFRGDKITYNIKATNTGDLDGRILIKDVISDKVELDVNSIKVGDTVISGMTAEKFTSEGIEVAVPAKTADKAGEVILSFAVTVKGNASDEVGVVGDVENQAKWNYKNPIEDPDPEKEHDTEKPTVPIVVIKKKTTINRTTEKNQTIAEGKVTANDEIIYTIIVENTGTEDAGEFIVKDDIPEGTTIKEDVKYHNNDLSDGELKDKTISWIITSLPAKQEGKSDNKVEISFTVTVDYDEVASKNIVNMAYVNDKPTNEVETPYDKPTPKVTPEIVKTGDETTMIGNQIYYKITYTAVIEDFVGKANIVIEDQLPYEIDEAKSNLEYTRVNGEESAEVIEASKKLELSYVGNKTIRGEITEENINTYQTGKPHEIRLVKEMLLYYDTDKLDDNIVNTAVGKIQLKEINPDNPKEDINVGEQISVDDDHKVTLKTEYKLPETGRYGTTIFAIIGLMVIGIAFVMNYKMKHTEE